MPTIPAAWLSAPVALPARKPATANVPPVTLAQSSAYRVDFRGNVLEFYSPYNQALVEALKAAIPYTHRAFKRNPARWEITPDFADALRSVVARCAGADLQLPSSTVSGMTRTESRLLDVRYVGRIKQREDGSENAFGWSNDNWSVIFPKTVLLNWFGQMTDRPDAAGTLFGVLGITTDADEKTIRSAWKRAARSWHPDVSKEPDAATQFQRIQHAYEVLSDPGKRAKYAAGLALAASVKDEPTQNQYEWTPPVRCGLIFAEGTDRLGRFIIQKILQWEDITDAAGRVLVTSWPMGATTFEEVWRE